MPTETPTDPTAPSSTTGPTAPPPASGPAPATEPAPDVSGLVRLDGKVALVTGASSGLGDRFARVLHAAGATVAIAARRQDRLASLADQLGERVLALQCDVTSDEDGQDAVEAVVSAFGQIDVLVNNAGTSDPVRAEDETVEHFRDVLEVNLVGTFRMSQLAGRHMLARGEGSIVNIASVAGIVSLSPIHQASYCASKGGVVNLTRELAVQWARRGVRVNALAPGWFASEMTADMWTDERSLAFVARNTPLARRGAPDELDGALLLLAGAGGSFITGQVLAVDGGWTAR
jgi:NAD(P)-dependent dehydrogenase (short-subunit alcohol dehydrogenase family)